MLQPNKVKLIEGGYPVNQHCSYVLINETDVFPVRFGGFLQGAVAFLKDSDYVNDFLPKVLKLPDEVQGLNLQVQSLSFGISRFR